uniref:Ig-like domain-containing protein n=1 Tax=Oncorhynchus tshawytscha TaxID=74940 RepID=A0AAZ3NZL9_ONCTS
MYEMSAFLDDLYLKVGGELVLTPDKSTVPDSIISVLWKHGKNKVAEWDQGFGGLDIYASFKERTTLDNTTGELRISGLKNTDSGVYSVEFNSKLLDKTYKLSVIKAVPKPTITSSCNPDKTSCTLTCEGDTTDAEPVTYSWKKGERAWEDLDKQLSVSKSTNGIKYTCKLSNAVSSQVSEPVGEVFGSEHSSIGVVVALVVVAIVAFAVIIVLLLLFFFFCGQCIAVGNWSVDLSSSFNHPRFLVWKKKTGISLTGEDNADKTGKGQGNGGVYKKSKGSDVVQPEQAAEASGSNSPTVQSKLEAGGLPCGVTEEQKHGV